MADTYKETLPAQIALVLSDRIITGQLPAGAKLRQDHIAAEFKTSHVPVREAFHRLEARGLLISIPRRGVRVTGIDPSQRREVAEMRASLEVLALRHASLNFDRNYLVYLGNLNQQQSECDTIQSWEAANRTFHQALIKPSNMPRLISSIEDLHISSARFLFAAKPNKWEPRVDHEHLAIIDALRKGQIEVACAILAQHVRRAGRRLGGRLGR